MHTYTSKVLFPEPLATRAEASTPDGEEAELRSHRYTIACFPVRIASIPVIIPDKYEIDRIFEIHISRL